ncbi:hypothetical protein D781_2813 [Serratia sp. FGI94]|uniref:hypothetical protein n=1 Tax=Serratia sp. FGI94 TaxID=671990 RepID=UPI0002A724FE|nr:hypothetical protein [Serratia sp. FGI94]AGB83056.1 hypothetical protein D781_2807 [Serratia sp. FGI94]AGB83057.1 hypothetical protein D781_2809 [Serratia sp. FGI94]AGB83059.1 hypothetical protein D781_2813 [Serratia sp. FGI94]
MNIDTSKLHKSFSLDATNPGSTEIEIKKMKDFFHDIVIPDEYLDFTSKHSDAEILVLGDSYIRIWGVSGCLEMNESYDFQKYIPHSLAIGDDEGGKALFYANGNNGFGLYIVGFGDLDINDATFVSESLYKLLIDGKGAEKLI